MDATLLDHQNFPEREGIHLTNSNDSRMGKQKLRPWYRRSLSIGLGLVVIGLVVLIPVSRHFDGITRFDSWILAAGAFVFAASVVLAGIVSPKYLEDSLRLAKILKFASYAVLFSAAVVDVLVSIFSGGNSWARCMQGFVAFFALIPLSMLLSEVGDRSISRHKPTEPYSRDPK